jgi:hypothetical protein
MSSTFPPITPGSFMDIPSWLGRDGIRIPESGLAVRSSPGASVSESAGSAALVGAGDTGDSIGVVDTQRLAVAGISRAAGRFTTVATSAEAESRAAELSTTELGPGRSRVTVRRLVDTLRLAERAAHARARSAATIMAASPEAIRRADEPVWAVAVSVVAAEAELVAVAADAVNRSHWPIT